MKKGLSEAHGQFVLRKVTHGQHDLPTFARTWEGRKLSLSYRTSANNLEISLQVVKQLKGISAAYRMTNKQLPTKHSPYVTHILKSLKVRRKTAPVPH